jgi:predicted dehydrogenase
MVQQMQDFIASVTDGRAPCAGIADGWASLQVCLGTIAAAEKGRIVSLADKARKA